MNNARNAGGLKGALESLESTHARTASSSAPKPAKAPKSKVQVQEKPRFILRMLSWAFLMTILAAGLLMIVGIPWLYAIEMEGFVPTFCIATLIIFAILGAGIGAIIAGRVVERNRTRAAHSHEHPSEEPTVELVTLTTTHPAPASVPAH